MSHSSGEVGGTPEWFHDQATRAASSLALSLLGTVVFVIPSVYVAQQFEWVQVGYVLTAWIGVLLTTVSIFQRDGGEAQEDFVQELEQELDELQGHDLAWFFAALVVIGAASFSGVVLTTAIVASLLPSSASLVAFLIALLYPEVDRQLGARIDLNLSHVFAFVASQVLKAIFRIFKVSPEIASAAERRLPQLTGSF